MKAVASLLALFLVIGLFARKINGKVRLLLLIAIAGVVAYTTFT